MKIIIIFILLFTSGFFFGGYLRNYRWVNQGTVKAHLWQWLPTLIGAFTYFSMGYYLMEFIQGMSLFGIFWLMGSFFVIPGIGYGLGYHLWRIK